MFDPLPTKQQTIYKLRRFRTEEKIITPQEQDPFSSILDLSTVRDREQNPKV